MSSQPRVAVVIPCFNDGPTLLEAVESALDQEPCEVVVVDDGSTDEYTLEVIRGIEQRGLPVVRKENGGVAKARMAGVRATSAPYVFPVDADDVLVPQSLTPLADHLDEHPEVDLVWGRYRFFGEKSHVKHVAEVLDPWMVTFINDLPALSMVRRTSLEACGGWNFERAYEDWDLWMRLASRGAVGHGLPVLVYSQRLHGVRMARTAIPQHPRLYDELRRRNAQLFRDRNANRKRSSAPASVKALFPLVDAIWPGDSYRKGAVFASLWHVFNRRGGYNRPFARGARRLSRAARERIYGST